MRIGFYAGAFTLGGAFGGLISYGLLQVHSSFLAEWQIVFIVEGVLTMLLGLAALAVLPSNLETAWFLTPEQKEDVSFRRVANEGPTDREPVSKQDVLTVLKDWRVMLLIVSNVCLIIPVTGVTVSSSSSSRGWGTGARERTSCPCHHLQLPRSRSFWCCT